MSYLRSAIGITLILLALAGGYYWETQGRQSYQQIELPVASVDIEKGEKINSQKFKIAYIDKKSLVGGALMEKDIHDIVGSCANQFIPSNSQLVASYFSRENTSLADEKSVFCIPNTWIFSRSSSLRKGDWVEIYGEEKLEYIGKYEIAFVKDQDEVEVENLEGPFIQKNILERTAAKGSIHHIELYCTLEEYMCLFDYVKEVGKRFILVQREELL